MAKRIQRKRTKGWRMPPGVVSVTRPGKWGNPFETAVEFRKWLNRAFALPADPSIVTDPALKRMQVMRRDIEELRGKGLACFCELTKDCHADVLLEFANREPKGETE